MKLHEKILIFFLSLLIVYSSIGTIVVFQQIKFYHKKSIRSQILNHNFPQLVEKLSFSKEDLNKGKLHFIEEHEFRFNGKLYDIIEKLETDDSLHFICINDTEEEKLEEKFLEFVINKNNDSEIPLPVKQILKLLNSDFYFQTSSINLKLSFLVFKFIDLPFVLIYNYPAIPDPPPKTYIINT